MKNLLRIYALFLTAMLACVPVLGAENDPAGMIPTEKRVHTPPKIHGLVLRMNFPNKFYTDTNAFEHFFNDDFWDTTENHNISSIYGYYKNISNNKLSFTNEIGPIISMPQTSDSYFQNKTSEFDFIKELIQKIKESDPNYFNEARLRSFSTEEIYTITNETVHAISSVSIIPPGYPPIGTRETPGSLFYPHAGHFINDSIELGTVDGKKIVIYKYQITPEKYDFNSLSYSVITHELGHIVGYEDYYDISYTHSGLGAHCLMSYSPTIIPAPLNPYLKWLSGWIEFKTLPDSQQNLVISPDDTQLYVKVNEADPNEFFILEARHRKNGTLTQKLPSTGLAIWHINMNYSGNVNNEMEVRLVQAGGTQTLLEPINGTFNVNGEETDYFGRTIQRFSATTTPSSNFDNGLPSWLKLENISYNSETGNVTLDVVPSVLEGDFKIELATFSKTSILEGEETVDLHVSYSGATVGDQLRLSFKENTLFPVDGHSLIRNLTSTHGNLSFKLKSLAIDSKRSSETTLSSLFFYLGDNNLAPVTPTAPLIIQENTPPIIITATPSKRIITSASERFTLTFNAKNSLGYDENESYCYVSNDLRYKADFLSGFSPEETPADCAFTLSSASCVANNVISDIRVTVGDEVAGKPAPQTVTAKLTTPIVFLEDASQTCIIGHSAGATEYKEQETATLYLSCYNAQAGATIPAPVFTGMGPPSPSSFTFTADADTTTIAFRYIATPNGNENGYLSPATQVTYASGSGTATYLIPEGVFIITNNEPGEVTPLPPITTNASPKTDGITLSWTPNGKTYQILRSPDGKNNWEVVGVTSEGEFTDTSAIPGKRYYFKITQ